MNETFKDFIRPIQPSLSLIDVAVILATGFLVLLILFLIQARGECKRG